jgi:hypothetical protein
MYVMICNQNSWIALHDYYMALHVTTSRGFRWCREKLKTRLIWPSWLWPAASESVRPGLGTTRDQDSRMILVHEITFSRPGPRFQDQSHRIILHEISFGISKHSITRQHQYYRIFKFKLLVTCQWESWNELRVTWLGNNLPFHACNDHVITTATVTCSCM